MFRNISELWKFRALIFALVGRHLRARYRGSLLGFVWSFLNPLCLIAVYSLVFRYYMRVQDVEHYAIFMFAGLLPWIWFSSGLQEATSSIATGGSLITKAMFPPHILPVVAVLTNLVHFLLAIPLLVGAMMLSGIYPTVHLLAFPLVVMIELIFLLGLSYGLSALNVHYRDIQHILGNLLTLIFFLCPIIYPAHSVPDQFRFTVSLNPLAAFTQMYHQMFLDGQFPDATLIGITTLVAILTFVIGNMIFNAYREYFAELV